MTIIVALYAGLARFRPAGGQDRKTALEVPDGSSVQAVIRRLGVPDDVSCVPVVNGVRASGDRVLRDGETLSLFPPLAGGTSRR